MSTNVRTCDDGGDGPEIGATGCDLLGGALGAVTAGAGGTNQVFHGFEHFFCFCFCRFGSVGVVEVELLKG